MRSRILPLFVIVMVLSSANALMGRKNELPATLSLRQKVDSEIYNLEKNLKVSQNPDEQWRFLEKTRAHIDHLRERNPRQFEQDEIYMDYLEFSLKDLPQRSEFEKGKCGAYRSAIISNYNPKFATAPDPAIGKTLGLLEILCK